MKYFLAIFLSASFIFLMMFSVSIVYGMVFPLKYVKEISLASEVYDVDPVLIASVIKSESGFKEDAISKKGAVGLMQLMPSTAEYLAEKISYGDFDLKNAVDNINLGTYYLSLLKDEFKDEKLVLCAYNAGPTNVRKWFSDDELTENGRLEKIPFKETENYVKKCMQAKKIYNTKRSYFEN